jgi:hypothetical protein
MANYAAGFMTKGNNVPQGENRYEPGFAGWADFARGTRRATPRTSPGSGHDLVPRIWRNARLGQRPRRARVRFRGIASAVHGRWQTLAWDEEEK